MASVLPFTAETIAMQFSEPEIPVKQRHGARACGSGSSRLTTQRAHRSDVAPRQQLKAGGQSRSDGLIQSRELMVT
jgi:hypothetical protein